MDVFAVVKLEERDVAVTAFRKGHELSWPIVIARESM